MHFHLYYHTITNLFFTCAHVFHVAEVMIIEDISPIGVMSNDYDYPLFFIPSACRPHCGQWPCSEAERTERMRLNPRARGRGPERPAAEPAQRGLRRGGRLPSTPQELLNSQNITFHFLFYIPI